MTATVKIVPRFRRKWLIRFFPSLVRVDLYVGEEKIATTKLKDLLEA